MSFLPTYIHITQTCDTENLAMRCPALISTEYVSDFFIIFIFLTDRLRGFVNHRWFSPMFLRAAVNLYSAAVAHPSQTKHATWDFICWHIYSHSNSTERVNMRITSCETNWKFWVMTLIHHGHLQILNRGRHSQCPQMFICNVNVYVWPK